MGRVEAFAVPGLPEIAAGADLAALIVERCPPLEHGDVVVVAHKAVSKAQGRVRRLDEIVAGPRARELAAEQGKDARRMQAILDEAVEVVRAVRGVVIVRTRHGFVCANAGIDESNAAGEGLLVLLPLDPDGFARELRARLAAESGRRLAVVIGDSFGRAWRHGQLDVAIGAAGLRVLDNWRGRHDRRGRELHATLLAIADAVTATADLARSKDSGEPVVIVRGLAAHVEAADDEGAAALIRPLADDLFR